jgi:hypothetical protein
MERRSPSRWQASIQAAEVYSFAAAVAVEDRGLHPLPTAGGRSGVQGIGDQPGVVVATHRPAQQVPRCQLEHAGQVQPALVGGDVGHIATPGDIRLVGVEQPTQEVGCGRRGRIRLGQAAAAARPMTDQAVAGHQPLHPLVVHPPAAPAKLGMYPRRPVGAARLGVDAADLGDQRGFGLLGR